VKSVRESGFYVNPTISGDVLLLDQLGIKVTIKHGVVQSLENFSMKRRTFLFESDNGSISIEGHIFRLVLSGFISPDKMSTITKKCKELISSHGIKLIIADQRNLKILPKETQEIIVNNFLYFDALGIRKIAIIESENVFTKLSEEALGKARQSIMSESQLQSKYFQTDEEAVAWLNS